MKKYVRHKSKPTYFADMCTASGNIEAKVEFITPGIPTPCEIVFNTPWGRELSPIECKSINEALKLAKEYNMPYRIFVGGECIKSGWR